MNPILVNFLQRLTSRKFLIAVIAVVTTAIAPLDTQTKAVIGASIGAVYILVEGLVDFRQPTTIVDLGSEVEDEIEVNTENGEVFLNGTSINGDYVSRDEDFPLFTA